jgi:ferredoxin--NADP+ reductase
MSIIKDPEVYERYDHVVLCHGVRQVSELAYSEYISEKIHDNEFFGAEAREKLIYYPTVTRETFRNQGRLTDLIDSGKLFSDIGLPPLNPETDRVMMCGSPSMLKDLVVMLEARGFTESRHGQQAHYVIERAFVEK